MKLLTVSIAAYKADAYIEKALDSIVLSKYIDEIQVVVVNDGSKDKTVDIVNGYIAKYPTSVDLIDKENGGYGSTINASLKIARGRYYKLLDADDWFNTAELDKLIESLKNTTADVVICDYYRYYVADERIETVKTQNIEYGVVHDIKDLCSFELNQAFTVKTEIIQNQIYITEKCLYTDVEFCAKSIINSADFIYYPYCVYYYRIGREGQSVSSEGRMKHAAEHEYVVRELYDIAFDKLQNEECKKIILRLFGDHINYYAVYTKPTRNNVKSFIDFCKYIDSNVPEAVNYFNGRAKRCYKHPKLFYIPTCVFVRCGHYVKKLLKRKK